MENRKRFLGIDGGGTRTTAIVSDESGHILAGAVGHSINYYSVGMDQARANCAAIMKELQVEYGFAEYDAAFIGMSALDQEASEEATLAFASPIIQAKSIYMHSDSYIALMAGTLGSPGGLIISGTGSMAIAMQQNGELSVVGGWGYLLGDQGSAHDIAMNGIKAAIAGYEQFGEETYLSQQVLDYFAISHMRELIEVYYNPRMERHLVAGFATEVAKCAEQGDKVAMQVIDQAVCDLEKHAEMLVKKLGNFEGVKIGVYGGVFQHNRYIYEQLKGKIELKHNHVKVDLLGFPPEIGAIICCFQRTGTSLTEDILQQLSTTYPRRSTASA
ncbi:BadF/BadG/BcrA/BcrD ATPase family protein [Paenibacillus sp. BC26]|uniref:BadF/BadG/BcrA/BcrD ATPase family protein n=1 Tax=Paenibacillus sp. BC26 TaxID=1881032 RepID=UPI0008EBCE95|nr:BadF/BadG/BcrA/BcrD ATPase family protein [Paenibacillus sp. BC26]SFT20659.1 BadF-type ATPase [Paenibacillus sp. BC26]